MDETIDLKEVILQANIIYNSNAKTKDEVLNQLSKQLSKEQYLTNQQKFIDDVYKREAEGITGIGSGIAIPHGKSEYVRRTTIAIALLKDEIEWETLDHKPIKLVFLFAVREEDSSNKHLLLLQKIAIKIADNKFIELVKNATSQEQIYQLICE